jgi:hypothetical protein
VAVGVACGRHRDGDVSDAERERESSGGVVAVTNVDSEYGSV